MAQLRPWLRRAGGLLVAGVLALAWLAWPPAASWDALRLMGALAGVDGALPPPPGASAREDASFTAATRTYAADWYPPPGGTRAGLVLVPGAAPEGRRDPRLVEFATMLSRFGFGVLVPDVPSFRELSPSPDSVRVIAGAADALGRRLGEGVARGIGAFSLATGPAVLAALEDPPDFLVLVGGYHDLEGTLRYLTTGDHLVDGVHRRVTPDAYGKWVYALANARRLSAGPERDALQALARRRMRDPGAPLDDLVGGLGEEGLAIYRFVDNTDPGRFDALLAALPAPVRADIAALDLAGRDLSGLTGESLLIHGVDDAVIPYTESVDLAAALPEGHVHLALLHGLAHVDRDIGWADAWKLWRVLKVLMAQRDRSHGP